MFTDEYQQMTDTNPIQGRIGMINGLKPLIRKKTANHTTVFFP